METPVVVAVAVVAAVIGMLLGAVGRTMWASQGMKAAQAEARRIEAEARTRQKELILEAKDEKLRLYAAHYSVMEGANDIARLAIRTCGGQSMMKHLPLERIYRDSRCGSLMLPWTAELVLDRMGRETLYEAGEKDE